MIDIPVNSLKIRTGQGYTNLPDWILFPMKLGKYLYDSRGQNLTILISVPSSSYIPLFTAIGIANEEFKNGILGEEESPYENLEENDLLLRNKSMGQEKVSFVRYEELDGKRYIVFLEDKATKLEVKLPEDRWKTDLIVTGKKVENFVKKRKLNKSYETSFEDGSILWDLYREDMLEDIAITNSELFYIVGKRKRIEEELRDSIFYYENKICSLKDFLFIKNIESEVNSFYKNGEFFSSQARDIDSEIKSELPVIFSDLRGYNRHKRFFKNNPKIIFSSRSENTLVIDDLLSEVHSMSLQKDIVFNTSNFLRHIELNNQNIPNGIEIIVWRDAQ